MRPGAPWTWYGQARSVSGPTWGGCLEIVDLQLCAGRYLLEPAAYAGCVLLLETSEELPGADFVSRVLVGMGERGLLQQFSAVAVAKPKAWDAERRQNIAAREAYTVTQREAIIQALDDYNPGVPTVFGLDFGHTDPQQVVPYGGVMTIDGAAHRVFACY